MKSRRRIFASDAHAAKVFHQLSGCQKLAEGRGLGNSSGKRNRPAECECAPDTLCASRCAGRLLYSAVRYRQRDLARGPSAKQRLVFQRRDTSIQGELVSGREVQAG